MKYISKILSFYLRIKSWYTQMKSQKNYNVNCSKIRKYWNQAFFWNLNSISLNGYTVIQSLNYMITASLRQPHAEYQKNAVKEQ